MEDSKMSWPSDCNMRTTKLCSFSHMFALILIFTTFILEHETASHYCVMLEKTRLVGSIISSSSERLEKCISSCNPSIGCVAVNYDGLKCLVYGDIQKMTDSSFSTAVLCRHNSDINGDCGIVSDTKTNEIKSPAKSFKGVSSVNNCKRNCLEYKECDHAVYDEVSTKCHVYFTGPKLYTHQAKSSTIICNNLKRDCSTKHSKNCMGSNATSALMFPPTQTISATSPLIRKRRAAASIVYIEPCICEEGYDWDDEMLKCEDINECTNDEKKCKNGEICENLPGGYRCDAPTTTPPTSTESSSNSNAVAIGAGVAVPLALIIVILVVCIVVYYKRRQNNVLKHEESKMKNQNNSRIQLSLRIGNISGGSISKPLDKWELDPQNIDIYDKLGNGAFGMVYSAFIDINTFRTSISENNKTGKKRKVAVKMLKDFADESEKSDFHEEIELMKKIGYHKNIVSMIGCSTVTSPKCLVVEYMSEGDLLKFLRKRRKHLTQTQCLDQKILEEDSERYVRDPASKLKVAQDNGNLPSNESLTPEDLISFAWKITSGMEYLASKKLVHRDLACRNILVGDDNNLKISDFGLSRYVNEDLIYSSKNTRKLPVRWMSIEAIFEYEFTTYSDVWAFGIVLFEIVTIGGTPYPGMGNTELLKLLKSGYRMEKPDNCSKIIYEIMLECWNADPQKRPSFKDLREKFEAMVSDQEEYITFVIDVEKSLYFSPSYDSEDEEEERVELTMPPHGIDNSNYNSTDSENTAEPFKDNVESFDPNTQDETNRKEEEGSCGQESFQDPLSYSESIN